MVVLPDLLSPAGRVRRAGGGRRGRTRCPHVSNSNRSKEARGFITSFMHATTILATHVFCRNSTGQPSNFKLSAAFTEPNDIFDIVRKIMVYTVHVLQLAGELEAEADGANGSNRELGDAAYQRY